MAIFKGQSIGRPHLLKAPDPLNLYKLLGDILVQTMAPQAAGHTIAKPVQIITNHRR